MSFVSPAEHSAGCPGSPTADRCVGAPGAIGRDRSRRSRRLASVVVSGVAMLAAMPAIASANQVIAFPERDFMSGDGFTAGAIVNYKVTHTDGSSYTAAVRADLDGLAEINHPGGACWSTKTPDVRAGDVVTATDGVAADAVSFTVPNTQVQRVSNPLPGTIVVKGWAAKDGGPIPGVAPASTPNLTGTTRLPDDQVESRIVAPRNTFALTGKRTLRASPAGGTEGTFTWDSDLDPTAAPTAYTATYTGLSQSDVDLAMSVGEARTLWLGSDPLNPRDGSIFESGDAVIGGSSAGFCDGTAGSIANIPSETPSTNLNPGLNPTAVVPKPTLALSNSQLNFSAKPGGNTNTQTLTVRNSGPGALGTFSVALTQPNTVTQPTAVTPTGVPVYQLTSNTCTGIVSENKTCQVQIRFTSPSAAGTYVGDVTISAQNIDGAVATRSAKLSGSAK
jgi:hypothetical protein